MSEEKPYVVYLPKSEGLHVPQKLDRSTLPKWNVDIKNRVQELYTSNVGESFILQWGPPYASSPALHVGHLLNGTLKDILIKQHLNEGRKVEVRFGWDCHGLPIENAVKNRVGSDDKELLKRECREFATASHHGQKANFHLFGIYSTGPDYLTMDEDYVQREKDIFNSLKDAGLIVKKNKPTWYSPSLGTTLANSEVEYQEVTEESVYFFFDTPEDYRLVVWTTTEWTVAGNQAVCLNSNIEYCKAGNYICSKRFAEEKGWEYEPFDVTTLTTYIGVDGEPKPILFDDFVQDDQTGIVHLCGGHGDEDFEVLTRNNIEPRNAVDLSSMLEHMENYSIPNSKHKGDNILRYQPITHSVTVDWRTKKRVIKVLTEQTYLDFDLTRIKAVLKQIKMTGRDRKRLEEMIFSRRDWCISRQRVWGVPIDENNILDVWFDSGTVFAMNDGPADIYIEGVDQHRGWFQSSVIIAAMMGRVPTRRIISHGFVVDKDMVRFQKSLGNGSPLEELYESVGPDVLRLWIVLSDYTRDVVFSKDSIDSAGKQYFKLRNWMRYFVNNLYREEHSHDGLDPALVAKVESLKATVSHLVTHDMNPSKAFREIVNFLGNYSSGLTEPRKDAFYESELDAPLRIELENEFHYLSAEVGTMLFPFTPFLSMELESVWRWGSTFGR